MGKKKEKVGKKKEKARSMGDRVFDKHRKMLRSIKKKIGAKSGAEALRSTIEIAHGTLFGNA